MTRSIKQNEFWQTMTHDHRYMFFLYNSQNSLTQWKNTEAVTSSTLFLLIF